MIETKEQYEEWMQQDIRMGHDAEMLQSAYETIEALREVARGANQQRFLSVSHPHLWNEELGDALDALPDWITED